MLEIYNEETEAGSDLVHIKQDVFKRHTQLIVIAWVTFMAGTLYADVIRNGTIGPDASIQPTGPDFLIHEQLGELKGTNLFHSFEEFSLNQNQSATFTGTSTIYNITGRITGGNVSTIDGILRSEIPGADLFLMNPHGVIFGKNVLLNVPEAFHASTGDELVFTGGDIFRAMPDGNVPILSTATSERFGSMQYRGKHP